MLTILLNFLLLLVLGERRLGLCVGELVLACIASVTAAPGTDGEHTPWFPEKA